MEYGKARGNGILSLPVSILNPRKLSILVYNLEDREVDRKHPQALRSSLEWKIRGPKWEGWQGTMLALDKSEKI